MSCLQIVPKMTNGSQESFQLMSEEVKTKPKKEPRVTMRSILIAVLRAGQNDTAALVALARAQFPDEADKRILSSLAVHRSVVRKEQAAAAAKKLAGA